MSAESQGKSEYQWHASGGMPEKFRLILYRGNSLVAVHMIGKLLFTFMPIQQLLNNDN